MRAARKPDALAELVVRVAAIESMAASVTAVDMRVIEMQISRAEDKILKLARASPVRQAARVTL
jgi:hypothetical protein